MDWMAERYDKDDILATKRNDGWVKLSVSDYCKYSEIMSYGFHELGLRKGDHVVTVTNNRPEFNIIDMGLAMLGVVHVPVYPTLTTNDYSYVINHSDAKVVILANRAIYRKVQPAFENFENNPKIFTLDHVDGEEELYSVFKQGILHRQQDAPVVQEIKSSILPSDVATMVYTSGTTGTPKGVVLTHENLVSNFTAHAKVMPMDSHCRALSFLPLCHVFERTMNYHYQYLGISIYYVDNMATIMQAANEVHAHGFCAVPRVLELMHDKLVSAGKDMAGIRKSIYKMALNHGYRFDRRRRLWYKLWQHVYDVLVYSTIRNKFGGNRFIIVSGGSALNPKITRLFHAAGLCVFEGYGLTETGPVIAVNNPVTGNWRIGTVGPVLPVAEVKLADDGEILVKSPSVTHGYYKDDRPVTDSEGWFHTGDVGQFEDGIFLKITDRKKELFKLSAGKYVAPQPIESRLKESEWIEDAMVVGENEKYVAALISPNYNQLHFYASKHKLHYRDNGQLIQHPEIVERFQQEIVAINRMLAPHEQIKGFRLVTEEWSPQTGELSPTLKLKRHVLLRKYSDQIAQIYNHQKEKEQGFSFKQINLSFLDKVRQIGPEKLFPKFNINKSSKNESDKDI
ncbi:MAG: long-chain fatty acid--CoA ligase [Bacteroidales bacterium]|nr:long-chain fatty acid--CoA ligase [Bacteroidales bacterium]